MQIQSHTKTVEGSSSASPVGAGKSKSAGGMPQALDANALQHVGGGRIGPVTCW